MSPVGSWTHQSSLHLKIQQCSGSSILAVVPRRRCPVVFLCVFSNASIWPLTSLLVMLQGDRSQLDKRMEDAAAAQAHAEQESAGMQHELDHMHRGHQSLSHQHRCGHMPVHLSRIVSMPGIPFGDMPLALQACKQTSITHSSRSFPRPHMSPT